MVLLWLLPPVVVTAAAMVWVAWLGRASRGWVDNDEAVRRLGDALEQRGRRRRRAARRPAPGYAVSPAEADRSTGVALRRPRPRVVPSATTTAGAPTEPPGPRTAPRRDGTVRRRAS